MTPLPQFLHAVGYTSVSVPRRCNIRNLDLVEKVSHTILAKKWKNNLTLITFLVILSESVVLKCS